MSLFTETVLLRKRGEPTGDYDDLGNPIFGPDVDVSAPAWYEPRTSGENVAARDQQVWGYVVYLQLDAAVASADAVVIAGTEYEVVGEPGRQPGGFIVEGYQTVNVEKATG